MDEQRSVMSEDEARMMMRQVSIDPCDPRTSEQIVETIMTTGSPAIRETVEVCTVEVANRNINRIGENN